MQKINFINNSQPAINDTNLNKLQDNVEDAIQEVQDVVDDLDTNKLDKTSVKDTYSTSATDTYSCNYVNSKTLKLLWENSNPSSTFASQYINLSSSDYDYLRIFYKGVYNQTSLLSIDTLKGFGFTLNFAGSAHVSGSGNYYGSSILRECTRTNDTKFNVPVCTVILGNNTTGGADNTAYCVPIAIYGGKF